jgi:hypothetical protein
MRLGMTLIESAILSNGIHRGHALVGEDCGVKDLVVDTLAGCFGASGSVGEDAAAPARRRIEARRWSPTLQWQVHRGFGGIDLLVFLWLPPFCRGCDKSIAGHNRIRKRA